MKFKEGDLVKIIDSCSGAIEGETGRLVKRGGNLFAVTKLSGVDCGCSCEWNWKRINPMFEKLLNKNK